MITLAKQKSVLVLALGWEQEPLIQRLSSLELDLYGVHYNADYTKVATFKEVLITDLRNLDEILDFAKRVKPDAVAADQDDYAHFAQAMIAEYFGLAGPTVQQAQLSTNKYLQRLKCQEKNLPHPEFRLITNIQELKQFGEQIGYPIIVKPIDNRGSFGVNKVNKEDDIPAAFYQAMQNSHSRLLIVERFIQGQEVTIDGYCISGEPKSLSLAVKRKADDKRQVSIDIKYPGELPKGIYSELMTINEKVILGLGYTFGMTHAEYIVSEEGKIYLVEAANRGGGCYTSEIIVPHVSGLDLVAKYINDILGEELLKEQNFQQQEVILKFFNFLSGKVKSIHGVEKLTKIEEVLSYRLVLKAEDEILPMSNDGNRHGFVIIKADSGVRQICNEIMNKVRIEYYD